MSCFKICLNYYQKPNFRVIKGNCLTGEGATNLRAPGIDNERIKVAYNCIKVNTDKRMFEGKVASTYTPDWKNIKDSEYGGISDKGGVAKNIVLVVGIFFEKEKAIILIDNPI